MFKQMVKEEIERKRNLDNDEIEIKNRITGEKTLLNLANVMTLF